MSRKKDPELVTPEKMAEMMSALYPVRARKNGFARFRYDFVISPSETVGVCIYPRKDGKGMKRMLALYAELSGRPYRKVLEEVLERNTAILIVDPIVYEGADWNNFLLVAIHEYAHYLSNTVGSVYKWDLRVNSFERTLGLLEEFNHRVCGKRSYKKIGPVRGLVFVGRQSRPLDTRPALLLHPLFSGAEGPGNGLFQQERQAPLRRRAMRDR